MAGPARASADGAGVILRLRVQPGARREGIEGWSTDPDGAVRLKVALAARAQEGAANRALIALLAKALRVPKGAVALRAGAAGRRKTVVIAGAPATILARLRDLAPRDGE